MFFHLTKQNTKVNPKHWVIVLLQVVFFTCFSFIQTIKACDDSSATLISMVNNGNGTYTFVIRVCPEFTGSFDPPNDEHTITVVGATIASFSPASLTHPNGSVYVSNAAGHASTSTVIDYYYPGFSAPGTGTPCYDITVTTTGLPTSFVVATNANGTAWECTTRTIVVGSTVQTTCATTTFQDPGGAANYSNNTAMGTTICPVTAGDHVQVAFNSFAVAANSGVCLDQLQIYQGTAPLNANYIGTYCNATGSPGTILSTTADGCLTFMFLTNDAGTAAGWNATESCVGPPCVSPPSATIAYTGAPYCTSLTGTQSPTITGTTGGTFSSSPAGLTMTAAGVITPSTSTAGTYTITYSIAATSSCPAFSTTTTVVIVASPTLNYTIATTNPSCSINNGAISITPVSPAGMTYNWVSGPVSSPISAANLPGGATDERALINLPAGTYCVDITGSTTSAVTQTIFTETFENGGTNWTINNTSGANIFAVNNNYLGGSCVSGLGTFTVAAIPNQSAAITGNINSKYLHIIATTTNPITCGAGSSTPFPPLNGNYNGSDNSPNQIATLNTAINTTGLTNIQVSFYWMGMGRVQDYAVVEYSSVSAGIGWTQAGLILETKPLGQILP